MKLLWKIYFWIFTLILALTLLTAGLGKWQLVDVIWFVSLLIADVILFAYAFNRTFGRTLLWKIIAYGGMIYYAVFAAYLDAHYSGYPAQTITDHLLTVGIPLFAFIANVLYFRVRSK